MAAIDDIIENELEPPAKVPKLSSEQRTTEPISIHDQICNFEGFQCKRVISENSQRKTTCLEGRFKQSDDAALVILEKQPFDDTSLKGILSADSALKTEFRNDIYGNYLCFPKPDVNSIKVTLIHPASEKHIKKFEVQRLYIIEETAVIYKDITLPFLQEDRFNIQWVLNILDHKSESERIVFEDPDPEIGFILLPDLKWNAKQIENLYLLAIVRKTGILSLRDLTDQHLPLLNNIKINGTKAIEDKYNIPGSRLRIYLHYQPSFYHLHIHFTNLQYDAPGIYAERAHLLSTVINNIKLKSDYYQNATIPFVVKENDNLFKRVLTEPQNSIMGSFASEILPLEQKEVKIDVNMYIPKVEAGVPSHIKCNCCGFLVKANINFSRVLPLPTNSLDMSEWFCHKHNNSESSELMSVRKGDCLYGLFFVLINDEELSSKGKVITCLQCLSWLGTCKTNVCKLWNCSVGFGSEINTNSPLQEFSSVIIHSLDKTIGIMNKIIVETVVSEGKTHYLLIWVLDRDLNIFFKQFTCDVDSISKDHETRVSLKSVLKVMYLFQEHCSELVKEWQADMYVQSIDVGKQMFTEGLNHLISLTECIPNPHQIWNNFCVSYIDRK